MAGRSSSPAELGKKLALRLMNIAASRRSKAAAAVWIHNIQISFIKSGELTENALAPLMQLIKSSIYSFG